MVKFAIRRKMARTARSAVGVNYQSKACSNQLVPESKVLVCENMRNKSRWVFYFPDAHVTNQEARKLLEIENPIENWNVQSAPMWNWSMAAGRKMTKFLNFYFKKIENDLMGLK